MREGDVRMIAVLGLAVTLVAGAELHAQPSTVEAIANYAGPDRQMVLEQGARREGSFLLYTTGTQIKPLIDRFEQKYPYVKVELARASSADTARKVIEEYRAGFEKVDAFELASHGLVVRRDEGIRQPFRSPELGAFATEAVEPGRPWVGGRKSHTGIGFNSKLIPAERAPKIYLELLDAQWRGKMAMSGVSTTAVNWVGSMLIAHGPDYVRKLGTQNIRIYNLTGRALANLM